MNNIPPEGTSFLPGMDVIAVLDNENLELAGDSLRSNEEIRLYGIGCSDKTIYYLDRGIISAMIVPDDFQMGYLAMTDIYNRLQAPNAPMRNREVSFEVITKENLYSPRHEAMLFPIIG
jgi:ribose transport system substrate-binding protein